MIPCTVTTVGPHQVDGMLGEDVRCTEDGGSPACGSTTRRGCPAVTFSTTRNEVVPLGSGVSCARGRV